MDELVSHGILGEMADRQGHFVLLKPPNMTSVKDLIDAILATGAAPAELGLEVLGGNVDATLAKLEKGIAESVSTLTLADLAERNG